MMPKALAALAGQALACIEDLVVIEKILTYMQEKETLDPADLLPESRAPPTGCECYDDAAGTGQNNQPLPA